MDLRMIEPEQCKSMTDVRAAIDALDHEIVQLLAKRLRYVDAAARIKQRRDQVRDDERVEAVIDRVHLSASAAGAPAALIARVYRNLIEECIAHELQKFDTGLD
jgi:isochorismate pyruvate lyase